MAPDELAIIARHFRPLAGEGGLNLQDDAARLSIPQGCELVLTADMLAAGVHFLPDDPPDTIAKKALRVNISDLAAKGATPLGYLLSLGIGPAVDETWLAGFASGLREDGDRFGIDLLGGDTISLPGGPVISITAIGSVSSGRMVHRFGGRPGDALYVSGTIGASTAGLAVLTGQAGPWDILDAEARKGLVQRYRVPEPRTALAAALVSFASAAMDVSDGLVGDCDKLAVASGCTAVIEAERVPIPPGLPIADPTTLKMLLTGGDDYEILAAVPPDNEARFRRGAEESGIPVARIGFLWKGAGATEVLMQGRAVPLTRRAYVHGQRGEG